MVSYEKIRLGCEEYHKSKDGERFDEDYNDYLLIDRDKSKWDQPDLIDLAEAGKIMGFLNLWKTPIQVRLVDFLPALQCAALLLRPIQGKTIPNVDLNQPASQDSDVTIGQLVETCFNILSKCGRRDEITASSKILHTINPELFVMWDNNIRKEYARPAGYRSDKSIRDNAAKIYATVFLPKMQEIACDAVSQIKERPQTKLERTNPIKELKSCLHATAFKSLKREHPSLGLAKVLDEYNFMKYTKNHPKLAD